MDDRAPKRKSFRSVAGKLLFVLFNVAVIAVTAYVDFGTERGVSSKDLLDMSMWYLFLVLACFAVTILTESLKYYSMIKHTTGRRAPLQAFEVAVLGKYYDFITPLGAGGQPFQVIYLIREGVEAGPASAIPIAGYIAHHAGFILISVVVLIFGAVVRSAVLIVPAIVGLLCYAAIPVTLVFFAVAPKAAGAFIGGCIRLLGRLGLLKDPEKKRVSAIGYIESCIVSLRYIYNGKGMFLRMLLLSLVYHGALCAMPYFVLRAFGNTLPFWEVFRSCVFIYLCITFIPTPGNSGAAEGSFYALFSVLGQGHLFWAMLVWRFFCYYSFIFMGLGATWAISRRRKREAPGRTAQKPPEAENF